MITGSYCAGPKRLNSLWRKGLRKFGERFIKELLSGRIELFRDFQKSHVSAFPNNIRL